jgi:hypothetical protein
VCLTNRTWKSPHPSPPREFMSDEKAAYQLEWIHNSQPIATFSEDGLLEAMDRMRANPGSRLVRRSDGALIATTKAASAFRPFLLRTLDSRVN